MPKFESGKTLRYGQPGKIEAKLQHNELTSRTPTLRADGKTRTLRYGEKGKSEARLANTETAEHVPTLKPEVKLKRGEAEAKKVEAALSKINEVLAIEGSSETISTALRNLEIEGAENGQVAAVSRPAPSIAESIRLIKANEEATEQMRAAFGSVNTALEEASNIQGFMATTGNEGVEDFAEDQKKLIAQAMEALTRFASRFIELEQVQNKPASDLENRFMKFCQKNGLDERFKTVAKRAYDNANKGGSPAEKVKKTG